MSKDLLTAGAGWDVYVEFDNMLTADQVGCMTSNLAGWAYPIEVVDATKILSVDGYLIVRAKMGATLSYIESLAVVMNYCEAAFESIGVEPRFLLARVESR